MTLTIFYSWQSDSPNSTNRRFIEEALEDAIKQVGEDFDVQEALRDESMKLDKDTKDVPGMPPIVETIFEKISNCAIFVPDLTFIGESESGRMLPNPNVLIEYGWALKSLSTARIMAVMNKHFGEPTPENLAFDMRHLRMPIVYDLAEGAEREERAKVKKDLSKILASAISSIVKSIPLTKTEPVKEIGFLEKPSTFLPLTEPVGFLANETPLFVPNVATMFLRIVPMKNFVIKSSKDAYEMLKNIRLLPMGRGYFSYSTYIDRNKYGAYICTYREKQVINFTQLFLTGQLWGMDTDTIERESVIEYSKVDFPYIPSGAFEDVFNKTLTSYMSFAKDILNLPLPLKFIAGATDIEGYKMAGPDPYNRFQGRAFSKHIMFEGEITDYSQTTTEILRPFFNHVWEEFGLTRPATEYLR